MGGLSARIGLLGPFSRSVGCVYMYVGKVV